MASTRDRLLTEGMRLFGERGYAATSVAQIESAAGLSPGSGSLYKHFRSKEELLTAGLDRLLSGTGDLTGRLATPPSGGRQEQLAAAIRLGLQRMEADRDVSRLMFRGLESFPELLDRFGQDEIVRVHRQVAALLAGLTEDAGRTVDTEAVAVVVQGATAHYWLLADLFGGHPTGVDADRFVAALAEVAAAWAGTDDSTRPDDSVADDEEEHG